MERLRASAPIALPSNLVPTTPLLGRLPLSPHRFMATAAPPSNALASKLPSQSRTIRLDIPTIHPPLSDPLRTSQAAPSPASRHRRQNLLSKQSPMHLSNPRCICKRKHPDQLGFPCVYGSERLRRLRALRPRSETSCLSLAYPFATRPCICIHACIYYIFLAIVRWNITRTTDA